MHIPPGKQAKPAQQPPDEQAAPAVIQPEELEEVVDPDELLELEEELLLDEEIP